MHRRLLTVLRILLTMGSLSAPSTEAQPANSVDLELVIAVDVSASMDRGEFLLQRRGYSEALRHPEFLRAIEAGALGRIVATYVEWSGTAWQKILVPWRLIDGAASAAAFARELDKAPLVVSRGTSISAALDFGAGLLAANPYDGVRKVVDISGDGPNNYGGPVTESRDAAVAGEIIINGLPIVIRPSPIYPDVERYYADCVIGGPGSFVLAVRHIDEFAVAIRRKLVLEVAGAPVERVVPIAAAGPADCLIGERARERHADPYLPGLDN